jgi:hypothetical protein
MLWVLQHTLTLTNCDQGAYINTKDLRSCYKAHSIHQPACGTAQHITAQKSTAQRSGKHDAEWSTQPWLAMNTAAKES